MVFKIGIEKWSAWAPGVEDVESWRQWSEGAKAIAGDGRPDLKSMPPMLRRRLDRMGRMALHTAYDLLQDQRDVPLVFASRTGETGRSVELLQSLTAGEPLSPTEFGLSVHNATGGIFTIARQDRVHCVAVSAGVETVAAALVESALLLQEHDQVLLVYYEEELPAVFRPYADEQQYPYAFSLLLTRNHTTEMSLGVRLEPGQPEEAAQSMPLPWGLRFLRLLAGKQTSIQMHNNGRRWDIQKNGVFA